MIETIPRVYLIGRPQIDTLSMLEYLRNVTMQEDGGEWWDRVGSKLALGNIPAAEGLVEFMGRLCYKSWEVGLNRNVQKVRKDRAGYLRNILFSGHGSVLEHAYFNFALENVSRVLTAELNRHRAGVAISEQSLRYVRLDQDIPFRLPKDVLSPESIELMRGAVEYLEATIGEIYQLEGIDSEEEFSKKKVVTSAVRRIAPLGMSTHEGWSANIRTIRHVIEMRGSMHAEEEIQFFAQQLYDIMSVECPLLFEDYEIRDEGITTEFRKV